MPRTSLVRHGDGGWRLEAGGAPYFVRGAGGTVHMKKAADLGANSVRTWNIKELDRVLEEAQQHGLTVCVGLWLKHASANREWYESPSHERAREEQVAEFVETVRKWAHHPAVLCWMIGNEANAEGCNGFAPLYQFIERCARAIKAADPGHVVGTVTTSPTAEIADALNAHAPSLEVWGVNVYGSVLERLPKKMREVGWTRAYLVTEYGPTNWWQVGATVWGARLEPTSTEKARTYSVALQKQQGDPQCVGGYCFKWGWKEQYGVTWICLINDYDFATAEHTSGALVGGETTEAVDELSRLWTGKSPRNRAPSITEPIALCGKRAAESVAVRPGAPCSAEVSATDPDGDKMQFTWMILPELGKLNEAAREGFTWKGARPEPVGECKPQPQSADGAVVSFTAPSRQGYYRLYVWVSDGHGHIATDNCPFEVSDAAPPPSAAAARPAAAAAPAPAASCILASASTFVRDGQHASSNFGTEALLETKHGEPGKGYMRVALLRFALPAQLPAAAGSWTLRLFLQEGDSHGRFTVTVHQVAQAGAWDERSTTAASAPSWTHAPLAEAAVAGGPGQWVALNVHSAVVAAGAGGVVSFAILNGCKTEKACKWARAGADVAPRLELLK